MIIIRKGEISKYKINIGDKINTKFGQLRIIDRFRKKNYKGASIKYYKYKCEICEHEDVIEESKILHGQACKECNKKNRKRISKEELIIIMKRYLEEHDRFTNREFEKCDYTPTLCPYRRVFGSVENALIECGHKIEENKKWLYNRKEYTKEELKRELIYYLPKHLKNNLFLPTANEIDESKDLPSLNSYYMKFNSMENLYSEIGINMELFNENRLKNDMKNKYKIIRDKIKKIPSRIDLDYFCKKDNTYYYSATTYCVHFGGMNNIHKIMGDKTTNWATKLSDEELLNLLKKFNNDFKIVPTQNDIKLCEYMPNYQIYTNRFGSFSNAIKLCGMTPRNKDRKIKTKKGNEVLSGYEYKFVRMLETYNIEFKSEEYYSKYIPNLNRKFRFDFTIFINNKIKFIEIFGIKGNEKYEARKLEKIKICKENNLKLICLSGDDVVNNSFEELFNIIND